ILSAIALATSSPASRINLTQRRFVNSVPGSADFQNARLDQAAFGKPGQIGGVVIGAQDMQFKSTKPAHKGRKRPPRPLEPLLSRADLEGANFQATSLIQAGLIQADLRRAN